MGRMRRLVRAGGPGGNSHSLRGLYFDKQPCVTLFCMRVYRGVYRSHSLLGNITAPIDRHEACFICALDPCFRFPPTCYLPKHTICRLQLLNTMSQIPSTTTSSSFETIFKEALEEYEKKTKKDIASHPLAAQLKSCDSPSAILAILRAQIQESDKSQGADERLTKWLDPTVNVLYAFSAILGDAVGMVISRFQAARDQLSDMCRRFFHLRVRFLPVSGSSYR